MGRPGESRAAPLAFSGWEGDVTLGRSEYVCGDLSTNTVEGYFSIFKRGMSQHCGEKHLHRYCAEFAVRCSNRVTADNRLNRVL